jgi:nucleoid-associated protein YgaU
MAQTFRSTTAIIGLLCLALLAAGALFYLAAKPDWQPTPPTPPAAATAGIAPPEFDIVRVDSSGNTVIAGRAAPGATITIMRGGKLLGTATADAAGSFAFLPGQPLPPGAQQLTLSEQLPNGAIIPGQASAAVDVPASAAGAALAVVSGPNGSSVMSTQAPQPGTLAMGTVDYDANGHAILSGTAPAGAHLTISLGGAKVGAVTAGKDGRWKLATDVPKASGTLTLAATDSHGNMLPAVTAPFALETLPSAVADGHVLIAPGQNLWLIARHVYGKGNLYTLIYNANNGQIKNPNLIFPGQAFSIPKP